MLHFIREVFILKFHYGPIFRGLHWCTDQMLNNTLSQMELTSSQGRILGYLAHREDPPCARDIEEHFHLSHPSVSGTLSRLEKKGFIAFRPDELDRRCKRICLLPRGMECIERMQQAISQIETQITFGFSPEERILFHDFLTRALTNMGGIPCRHREEEEIDE